MLELNDGRSELWQWDTGRTLIVDTDCSQVHFSNKVFGRSIDVDVNVADGVAIIPDVLLQTDKDLNVWAFSGTAENGYTKISKTFKVNRRNKPADYVFTPPDQTSLEEIKERVSYLESMQDPGAIKNAVEDYLEKNPVEAPVQSVNGQIGKVELTAKDVGAISQDDLANVQSTIAAKMDSYTIKTVMDSVATPHTQYYLGNQTAVDIVLPDSADVGQIITVSWYNGETAATLSITGTMLSFDYTPSANTRSEINALWDGTYWAVLGNEMEVPTDAETT